MASCFKNRTTFKFKEGKTLEERKDMYTKITEKYSDRVPIICEPYKEEDEKLSISTKYITPGDITVGQFLYIIRKRITLEPSQALYLFVNNTLPASTALIKELYAKYKDEDGFLYIKCSTEDTFGCA